MRADDTVAAPAAPADDAPGALFEPVERWPAAGRDWRVDVPASQALHLAELSARVAEGGATVLQLLFRDALAADADEPRLLGAHHGASLLQLVQVSLELLAAEAGRSGDLWDGQARRQLAAKT